MVFRTKAAACAFLSFVWVFGITVVAEISLASHIHDVVIRENGKCGENLTWSLDEDGELIIKGSGDMFNYGVGKYPWSQNQLSVTRVVIKEGVTSIGDYAFSSYSFLTNVSLSDTLTSIGESAFSSCGHISSITIGKGVSSIGLGAFSRCTSLQSFTVKAGNTHFSEAGGVLYDLNKTVIISYPLAIDNDQFEIPSGVTSIGDYAFYFNKKLKSITLPDSITTIGDFAFGSSGITTIFLPNHVSSIGESAFRSCGSLDNVTIPTSVRSIGDHCFASCSSLMNLTILNGVTSIDDMAFSSCTSLTHVKLPQSVNTIGSGPFSGCTQLSSIEINRNQHFTTNNGVLFDYEQTRIIQYPPGKNDTDAYIIPSSVTSIGDNAFYMSTSLINITIPSSVKSIGENAFGECSKLENVDILNGVKSVGVSAFSHCRALRHVNLPDTLESIEESAFSACGNLENVDIPNGVKSIGVNAFYACSLLESVIIPDSVTSIGDQAFRECGRLKYVTIPESITYIGYDVFSRSNTVSLTVYYQGSYDLNNTSVFSDSDSFTVCVSPDYNASTFCGIKVSQDIRACGEFRKMFNHCNKAACLNGTMIEQKRKNATEYEGRTNDCAVFECDEEKGPLSRSKCNNNEGNEVEYICLDGNCVEKRGATEEHISVEIELTTGLEVDEVDSEEIIGILEEVCEIERGDIISIAWEADEEGKIRSIRIVVNDESTAKKIADPFLNEDFTSLCAAKTSQ